MSAPPNFTRPVYTYSHGGGTFQGFAITGGAFYNPATSQFPADYAGDYFFGDFVNDWMNVVNVDGSGVRQFATGANGVVDLRVANDGSLYYLTRGLNRACRVTYTAPPAQDLKFDFGTASSPLAGGFTRVTEATGYSAAQGFGWSAGVITARDRGAGTALTRDFNFTTDGRSWRTWPPAPTRCG